MAEMISITDLKKKSSTLTLWESLGLTSVPSSQGFPGASFICQTIQLRGPTG